jgi:hypothetical protein
MQKPFPPGAMCEGKITSAWREFEFMLHQVQRTVIPDTSLEMTIQKWQSIRAGLSENSRLREMQMKRYPSFLG